MSNNPTELARLEEERKYWYLSLFEGIHSKSTKQFLLNKLHDVERQLGIELTRYNGIN